MELPSSLIIQRGTIFHSTVFDYIDHGKFFAIIGENNDNYVGFFFINSNIHPINKKTEQLKLQYLLLPTDYNFLSHNSYLCCTQIATIPKSKLEKSINEGITTIKGQLKQNHINDILNMVRVSKLFSKEEKETFFK